MARSYKRGILNFTKTENRVLKWFYHFVFPPAVYESSSHSTFLSALGIVGLLILAIVVGICWYLIEFEFAFP